MSFHHLSRRVSGHGGRRQFNPRTPGRAARRHTGHSARRRRHPALPCQHSRRGARRSPPTHRGNPWPDREPVTDQSQGVQLATIKQLARTGEPTTTGARRRRSSTPCRSSSPISTASTSTSSTSLEAPERAAGDHHPRLARLDHRADEDHRPADQSHRAWRERGGRLRCRHSVASRLRLLRQAHGARMGSRPHRPRLGGADGAPRLQAICRAGRRLGRCRHRADGAPEAGRACSASTPTCLAPCPTTSRRRSPAGRRRPASRRREICLGPARLLLQASASAMRRRWATVRRRSTGSRIRRSAWPPGCSTTTRPARS